MADETLRRLWGRVHVRELEDVYFSAGQPDAGLRDEITACSLEAGVLCRFTAFVAVDESERVPDGLRPHKVSQSVELPDGWRYPTLPVDQLISLRSSHPGKTPKVAPSAATTKICELLLKRGIIGLDQLREAEEISQKTDQDVGQVLIRLEYAEAEEVSRVVAEVHSLAFLDLRTTRIDENVIELVPESVARENNILPVDDHGAELIVATSDPNDLGLIEKLRFILARPVSVVIAPKEAISGAINQYYGLVEGESADSMLQEFTDTAIDFTETDGDYVDEDLAMDGDEFAVMADSDDVLEDDAESLGAICQSLTPPSPFAFAPSSRSLAPKLRKNSVAPGNNEALVIRLVNLIIAEAVQLRASHVLIMPEVQSITISYVIDGRLVERESAPRRMLAAIIARLKILAKLDITLKDQPQSGIVHLTVGDQSFDAWVHLAPCDEGTTALIELDQTSAVEPESIQDWRSKFWEMSPVPVEKA